MSINRKSSFLFVATLLLVLLVVTAFFPPVLDNSRYYSLTKYGVFGLLVLLAFFSKCYKSFQNEFIRKSLIITIIAVFLVFFLYAFSFRIGWYDATSLISIVLAVSIGYSLSLKQGQIELILLFYGVLAVVLGIYSMIYFVGAITLADYMYAVDTKNLVGQIVATAGIGLVVTTVEHRYLLPKIVLIGLVIILLVVLRCKTAFVAFILFAIYYFRSYFKSSFAFVLVFLVAIACVVYSSQIYSFFERVFVGTKEVVDLNDFTSDRIDRDRDGIAFFISHPIWGELKVESGLENIHNYVIKRLAAYGIFSFPFMVFYFFYFINLIKQWLSLKHRRIECAGLLMLIIPFFSSLLEPSAPFGPGLIQVVPFVFYGLYLRRLELSTLLD